MGRHPRGAQHLQSCTHTLLDPRARVLGQENRKGKQRVMGALTDISISVHSPNGHGSVKYIDDSGHRHPCLISIKASMLTKGPSAASAYNLGRSGLSMSFQEGDMSAWVGQEVRSQVALFPHVLTLRRTKKPWASPR